MFPSFLPFPDKRFLMLLVLIAFVSLVSSDDELLQVHVVYRHGDRTPIQCYPTDPYLSYWNNWESGELTTVGMQQHYLQGLRLKARYIDQLRFINATYHRDEIYVQSSLIPRCIQSAYANLAAFYSASQGTLPDVDGWPLNWSPIPIHSLEEPISHMLDPGKICPRENIFEAARADNKQFLDYALSFSPMIVEVQEKSGDHLLDATQFADVYDCIRIEREFNNLTLPSWITDKIYNEIGELYWRTCDYIHGQADFGESDNHEIIRIRGGPLLTEIIDKMQQKKGNTDSTKMYVYSAHDITLMSLWRTLGAKQAMSGSINPDYAAMYALELWSSGGDLIVKAMYSANDQLDFVVNTGKIEGCPDGDSCPLDTFIRRSQPYMVANIRELCNKV